MMLTPMTGINLLLSDLDGVVYRGSEPVPFSVEGLARCAQSAQIGFVTNSAARSTETISAQLNAIGINAEPANIVTSAHASASLLPSVVAIGNTVLVVGSESLKEEIAAAGYEVTRLALDEPAAVVQGFSMNNSWTELSQAARALRFETQVAWIATNLDSTVPSPDGLMLENGAMVAAISAATARTPIVAGKPEAPIYQAALDRFSATTALFVGDRLDTDIVGARRAGLKSALVLTGVDGMANLLAAPANMRPDFILEDLRGLSEHYEGAKLSSDGRSCEVGGTIVELFDGVPRVTKHGTSVEVVRATCALVWHSNALKTG